MGRGNRQGESGGRREAGDWRERFIERSRELAPEFEGHEKIADRAAAFYDLPEREQQSIIARILKAGYKDNSGHGDVFPISDNGKIYVRIIHQDKDGAQLERPHAEFWEDRHPESDERFAEGTAPPFLENDVAEKVCKRMLEAADYIANSPEEESLFDSVDSREEWERRRDEGTLNPDGKITAISISEEDFKEVQEQARRAERGLPSEHAPAPGDIPPWER